MGVGADARPRSAGEGPSAAGTIAGVPSDAGGAATAAVAPVLCLLLLNREVAESDVPVWCHRLLAAIPLVSGLTMLPPLRRANGTRRGGISILLLTALPALVAVILAATMAPMTFDEEKW